MRSAITRSILAVAIGVGAFSLVSAAQAETRGVPVVVEAGPPVVYVPQPVYTYASPAAPIVYYGVQPAAYYYAAPGLAQPPAATTCSEGNWRRADGVVVYGVACLQQDGMWHLAR